MVELIDTIKGMATDIYNDLGSGFDESIYQKALEVACRLDGLQYENQRIIPIYYRGHNIGESKADLIINTNGNTLVVELKAIGTVLSAKEESQLRKYMSSTSIPNGLLMNFPQAGRKGCADEPEFIIVTEGDDGNESKA